MGHGEVYGCFLQTPSMVHTLPWEREDVAAGGPQPTLGELGGMPYEVQLG
jgi:hypothetical protein